MTLTVENLKRFCSDEDETREYLRSPWTRDGFTWASNGKILVRAPALPEVESTGGPNTTRVWETWDTEPDQWFPVPECAMPPPMKCTWCDGTGKDPSDRRFKCDECKGTKIETDWKSHLLIGGVAYAKIYLALIQGWEIAPNGLNAAWIRKGDCLGLLMPMCV